MKFEKVSFESFRKDGLKYGWTEEAIRVAYDNVKLPEKKTKYSAGYDFVTPYPFTLNPGHQIIIPTGIKVRFEGDEANEFHLALYVRSSIGIHHDIVLSNGTGVIDADYYNNEDNEGDMLIALYNRGYDYRKYEAGYRIMQGVFVRHGHVSNDFVSTIRRGGVGSTNEE